MLGAAGECAGHEARDDGCRNESHGLKGMYSKSGESGSGNLKGCLHPQTRVEAPFRVA
jgi:hypothetical protein